MNRVVGVEVSVRLIFPALIVGSIYLLLAGHNQPGGGFVGGIVAGAAVTLRYVAGGVAEVRSLTRARPWTVLGAGLLVAGTIALVPLAFGDAILRSYEIELDVAVLGHLKLTTSLVFDVGVYLVVFGLVLMVFESFGDDPPEAVGQ
jgi:multisubunit Na+/H+ antiporter MnhB subunit